MTYFRNQRQQCFLRLNWACIVLFADIVVGSFTSEPRWGQAVAVVNNLLFVSGGKTDEFGAYSYTSAPTTNDLFTLDLSNSFDPSEPPWKYLSGSQDTSTPQGQELAWHSISACNATQVLLFGGDGGPNSPIVLPSGTDSAQILQINGDNEPSWISESEGWAGQPSRRIHHSTASVDRKVYIFGGEKDDGSTIGFSEHYVFDSSAPGFSQLPSNNGPPDIYGHACVLLSDGRILVFGGYSASESRLIPFSTIWSIDTTQSSLSWTMESVSDSSLPTARRAFAATWIEGDRILIHGGSDDEFQTSYSDGWVLDTTSSPMTWTNVSILSQIGARRDHFAVQVGSQVLFGFGYGTNAGASIELLIYDYSKNTFTSSFTPQSSPSQTTLPASTGTGGSSSGGSQDSGSGATNTNHDGPQSTGVSSLPTETSGTKDPGDNTAVIAVASVLGLLAIAIAAGVLVVIIIRRRRTQDRFHLLSDDESGRPGPSFLPSISIISWFKARRRLAKGEKVRMREPEGWTILGLSRRFRDPSTNLPGRIDMFANEDASEFAVRHVPRRFQSGSSRSWISVSDLPSGHERYGSSTSERHSIGRLFSGSLRQVGNNVKRIVSGGSSRGHEKDISLPLEEFDDSEGLLLDESNRHAPESPTDNNRVTSNLSNNSSSSPRKHRLEVSEVSTYSDPFQDGSSYQVLFNESTEEIPNNGEPERISVGNSSSTESISFHSPQTSHVASSSKSDPENTSASYLQTVSNSGHSSSSGSNQSSTSQASLGRSRTTSLLGSSSTPSSPVKRSDSWWSRFKLSPLRDQSGAETRSRPTMNLDFRDPNPPPVRLGAIKEASNGSSMHPESVASSPLEPKKGGELSGIYSSGRYQQSKTSLKTNQTADSAALEKIAGHIVVLREGTGSSIDYSPSYAESVHNGHNRSETISSLDHDLKPDENETNESRTLSGVISQDITSEATFVRDNSESRGSLSTSDFLQANKPPTGSGNNASSPLHPFSKEKGPVSGGIVANRIAEYERRMSLDSSDPRSPPTSPTKRTSRPIIVKYGLAHRPELFVANPDNHSLSGRSDN